MSQHSPSALLHATCCLLSCPLIMYDNGHCVPCLETCPQESLGCISASMDLWLPLLRGAPWRLVGVNFCKVSTLQVLLELEGLMQCGIWASQALGAPTQGSQRVQAALVACALLPQSKSMSAVKKQHKLWLPLVAATNKGTCGSTKAMCCFCFVPPSKFLWWHRGNICFQPE